MVDVLQGWLCVPKFLRLAKKAAIINQVMVGKMCTWKRNYRFDEQTDGVFPIYYFGSLARPEQMRPTSTSECQYVGRYGNTNSH